jgi:hypothetical protein
MPQSVSKLTAATAARPQLSPARLSDGHRNQCSILLRMHQPASAPMTAEPVVESTTTNHQLASDWQSQQLPLRQAPVLCPQPPVELHCTLGALGAPA